MPVDAARRQVLLLSALFAASTVSGAVAVAAASLVGGNLAGREDLATLPLALALVGGTAAAWPASQMMARWGRRAGFAAATAVAAGGAALAAAGIWTGSFVAFCAGSFLMGVLGGVAPYYRFAAVEVSPSGRAPRAIAAVLAGGLVAGLVGPHFGAATRGVWPAAPFAGSYAALAVLALVILAVLPALRVPPPVAKTPGAGAQGRPVLQVLRQPRAAAALVAGITAFAAMVLTMVAAPLSLARGGDGFEGTALVIQAHVVAMFAPALVSGRIVARFGHGPTMAAGLVTLAACVAVNLAGHSVAHHWVALALLGVGWNLLFVAGSALLTQAHRPEETARVQGANDFAVAAVGAGAALGAGPLHAAVGWTGLNVAVGAFVVAAAMALALLLSRGRAAQVGDAAPGTVAAKP